MYRIRFHGRGGQGMKTASRVLGSAFFIEGYEVQDAPRYGAERRGAPIFAYVRASKHPINERGIILRPDLVVVADVGVDQDSQFPVARLDEARALREEAQTLLASYERKQREVADQADRIVAQAKADADDAMECLRSLGVDMRGIGQAETLVINALPPDAGVTVFERIVAERTDTVARGAARRACPRVLTQSDCVP